MGVLHCNCNNAIYLITCKNCWNNMLLLLLIEYIKAISKPTKIYVVRQSILMVCVKMITIFFSFCLLKLLNKFIVMPQRLNKILYHGENYWQSQLFIITHGMNSLTDLCCFRRKGCRKL